MSESRPCDRYIGLIRVSTKEQEDSELGLKAGRADLERFIAVHGGELLQVLQEVESGKLSTLQERPMLQRAIALCKRRGACLLVPKVDRLVRSTEVATDIKRSGVRWRACDNPHANEFMIDVLVSVAANEVRDIASRTRKALGAYKADNRVSKRNTIRLEAKYGPRENWPQWEIDAVAGKLGACLVGSRLTDGARSKGSAKASARRVAEALGIYEDLAPDMKVQKDAGLTLAQIATRLNERGERTRTDALWSPVQVHRCIRRYEEWLATQGRNSDGQ